MTCDCKTFIDFYEQNPALAEETLQRICELHYAGEDKGNGIRFDCRHAHDAINYVLNGSIQIGEQSYRFTVEDGNWRGTVVREWGTEETVGLYKPPPPPIYDMVPVDDHLQSHNPALWKVYLAWKKEPWFAELLGGYAYDAHFAPGTKTEQYWRDKAAKKGLKIVSIETEVQG